MRKVLSYYDSSQEVNLDEFIDCGGVILASNLAGRGTDISPSEEVEKNGGMHVIISFLPINSRVERQA
jgi:preprotein translocase subunit SecA